MAGKNGVKSKAASSRRAPKKRASGNGNGKMEEPRSPMPAQHQPKPGIEAKLKPRPRTGLEGSKELLDYASTKGAIHAFTKSLAQNLVERGIRVNCVAPGPVWTPLNPADKEPEDVAQFGADTPMKRPAQPEEIAPAYVYFASEVDSSYVTGEVLTLLGGETTAG